MAASCLCQRLAVGVIWPSCGGTCIGNSIGPFARQLMFGWNRQAPKVLTHIVC